jgi:hypothetical protein
MRSKQDSETLLVAITRLGFESRKYSGRGMYGKYCFGIDIGDKDPYQAVAEIMKACMEYELDNFGDTHTANLLIERGAIKVDSLGRGSIVYFPEFVFIEQETNEDDIPCSA